MKRGIIALSLAAALGAGCARRTEPANEKLASVPSAPLPAAEASASAPSEGVRVLVREEVVPGKLWVTVYSHALEVPGGPSLKLWTYASEGLWPLHQREIRFSVKREPDEAEGSFDRDIVNLYALIYDLAAKGQLVDVNGHSELGGPPLLGRDDFHCILYGPPQPISGIGADAPFLSAVFVTCEEYRIASRTGYTRIFARLGAEARYYPTPFWTDKKRASVARPDELEKSLIAKAARTHLPGVSVRLERKGGLANHSKTQSFFIPGDRIVLRVFPRGAAELKKVAAQVEDGILMLLEMDPASGTSLVWYPGQTTANAIACATGGSERITGNFLFLVGGQKTTGATANEDGFSMFFKEATWKRVREALVAGKPITIPGEGDVPELAVEQVETTYVNPIDGKRYESEQGWDTAKPTAESAAAAKRNPLVDASIVLLTNENDAAQRISVEELGAVVKPILLAVDEQVGTSKGPGSDLVVECEILPGKKKSFQIAQRPTVDKTFAQAIYDKLDEIPIPEVKGPVKFQVVFKIRGGSKLSP